MDYIAIFIEDIFSNIFCSFCSLQRDGFPLLSSKILPFCIQSLCCYDIADSAAGAAFKLKFHFISGQGERASELTIEKNMEALKSFHGLQKCTILHFCVAVTLAAFTFAVI